MDAVAVNLGLLLVVDFVSVAVEVGSVLAALRRALVRTAVPV